MPPAERLFVRALLAFLALPGVVAFALPLVVIRPPDGLAHFEPDAVALLLPGLAVLFACVREFYVTGKGTLAPWAPPKHLVVSGLYRFTRNPMYVGVLLIVSGWALGYRSRPHALYAVVLAVGFHLRVLLNEEPYLAHTHGAAWLAYRARVPRWFGVARRGAPTQVEPE